jgi:hypothetical protein
MSWSQNNNGCILPCIVHLIWAGEALVEEFLRRRIIKMNADFLLAS